MDQGDSRAHSVGKSVVASDGLSDIWHATAQGIIVGANAVIVDVHPDPSTALCDGFQAIVPTDLPRYVRDTEIVRRAYNERRANSDDA